MAHAGTAVRSTLRAHRRRDRPARTGGPHHLSRSEVPHPGGLRPTRRGEPGRGDEIAMMPSSATYRVRVRGEWACFTRPELKTERVTYHVITPSAARGAVEAVLWKPAIRWRVHRIAVLAPIKFAAVKRSEVNKVVPV